MKYTENGYMIIGILCALTIYNKNHHLDISNVFERDLITRKTDVKIKISYGYRF